MSAYLLGQMAYEHKQPITCNPYVRSLTPGLHRSFVRGWEGAQQRAVQRTIEYQQQRAA